MKGIEFRNKINEIDPNSSVYAEVDGTIFNIKDLTFEKKVAVSGNSFQTSKNEFIMRFSVEADNTTTDTTE